MKKFLLSVTALIVALGMTMPVAEAAKKKKAEVVVTPAHTWTWPWGGPWTVSDPRLATTNAVVGGAATGVYFATKNQGWSGQHPATVAWVGTSIGCAAISPIIGTLVMNRPLTLREAHVSTANCFLPFIGGWLVNAAFDANPHWEPERMKVAKRR